MALNFQKDALLSELSPASRNIIQAHSLVHCALLYNSVATTLSRIRVRRYGRKWKRWTNPGLASLEYHFCHIITIDLFCDHKLPTLYFLSISHLVKRKQLISHTHTEFLQYSVEGIPAVRNWNSEMYFIITINTFVSR